MSGRNRSRKSSRAKNRGKARAKAPARATPEDAARDADPPRGLGEETQAAQVQAGAGWGGLETAEPAPPRSPGEEATCGLPLDCGLALRARAAAGRGLAACRERLGRDPAFLGTVGMARPKAPHPGSAAGSGAQKDGAAAEGAAGSVGEAMQVENGAGSGPEAAEGSMDTLETVQQKLDTVNAQADRAYLRLSRKFGQLRLHHLERRNLLIQSIPGFWAQAFRNHPQLASFLSHHDKKIFSYLHSLDVEELGLARLGYKIKFYFARNPFFQNKVLIKEYGCGPSGQVVSRSTPIQWLPGQDLQALCQGDSDNAFSFFWWFSNHSSIESDKMIEIINEELWPNPLQYYLLSEGAPGEKGKEVRKSPEQKPKESSEVKPSK
ncbi:testis-specific Y-encoded-like protein 5 [Tenrec ecaudatus]|uniref:testis-specific Y-encoded-like protein 5 n=1 Tax=Tenrec ecaudatus TaxID=94439 RepID=UPI003F590FA4